MERDIYDEDHEAFRDVVKEFIKRHVTNDVRERWDAEGEVDRGTMLAAQHHAAPVRDEILQRSRMVADAAADPNSMFDMSNP